MFVLWWKVFLADFVGGGFHPFVEPWFILFLGLFLDSLPAFSGIDYSSAFSESLSVQSNVSSSSSHTCNDSALALTFPLLNFVTIFSAAFLCGQKKYVYSVPERNLKQQKEKARKLFVSLALEYICISHLKSTCIGTLTFICAGWERHIRGSAVPKPAESFNSEKFGITISCFMGLVTH